jgi:hypothetical protein
VIFVYVLVAIALSDQPNTQTIRYFDTIGECHTYKNKIEPTINKAYVRLDCIPKRVDTDIAPWRKQNESSN